MQFPLKSRNVDHTDLYVWWPSSRAHMYTHIHEILLTYLHLATEPERVRSK